MAGHAGNADSMFSITEQGRAALVVTQRFDRAKLLMKFRLPGRKSVTSKEELSRLTAFELTLELAAAGWTPSEHGRSKKLDAYKEGTPKCWYYSDKHDQTLMKSYLMTLLRSPALFSSGLKEVHHFQIRAYYEAILSSPQPGKVLANQPAAYYTVLLQNEARPQRDRRDPATLASDDDGGAVGP